MTASGGTATDISLLFNLASETKYVFGLSTDTASFTAKSLTSSQTVSIGNIKSLFIHTNCAHKYYLSDTSTINRTSLFTVIANLSPSLGVVFYLDYGGDLNFEQVIENVQGLSNIKFVFNDLYNNEVELSSDWIMGLDILKTDSYHTQKLRYYLRLTR